jgi:hypothetical protein
LKLSKEIRSDKVLAVRKQHLFLLGDGFTKNGQFPFIDDLDLKTSRQRLYTSTYMNKEGLIH